MSEPTNKKVYDVTVTMYAGIVVEAEDDDEALDIATTVVMDRCSNAEHDETSIDKELKTPIEVDRALRHSTMHFGHTKKRPFTEDDV